jgi:hypothetical protein
MSLAILFALLASPVATPVPFEAGGLPMFCQKQSQKLEECRHQDFQFQPAAGGHYGPRGGTPRDAALTPLAGTLGFVRLPGAYFVFLGGMTVTDLALVELVKRRLMRKLLGKGTAAEPLLRSVA